MHPSDASMMIDFCIRIAPNLIKVFYDIMKANGIALIKQFRMTQKRFQRA